jgi:hypothetical protein
LVEDPGVSCPKGETSKSILYHHYLGWLCDVVLDFSTLSLVSPSIVGLVLRQLLVGVGELHALTTVGVLIFCIRHYGLTFDLLHAIPSLPIPSWSTNLPFGASCAAQAADSYLR